MIHFNSHIQTISSICLTANRVVGIQNNRSSEARSNFELEVSEYHRRNMMKCTREVLK